MRRVDQRLHMQSRTTVESALIVAIKATDGFDEEINPILLLRVDS